MASAGRHSPPFARPDLSDLRIVLIGKNGSENRRVGNTILGTTAFNIEAASYSQQHSERISGAVEGRHITVINTHLLQTNLSQHQITQRVRECVSLSAPGPHVFVLVLLYKDFTENDRHRVKYVLKLFSYQAMKHTIVLTTDDEPRGSILASRNNSIHDLIKECGGGHLQFDTVSTGWRSEMFRRIEEMLKKERKEFLICNMFEDKCEETSVDEDLSRSGASVRDDDEKTASDGGAILSRRTEQGAFKMQFDDCKGQYDVTDKTLKFFRRIDDITLDDDHMILRAEMSCGHVVSLESLTAWCRSLLDRGQYKFYCPAITHGTKKCNAVWPYLEVRRLGLLSDSEKAHFEENMALLAASEYCEFKSCPSCGSYVEREDLSTLCVRCTICTSVRKNIYKFCWQCLREWKGAAAHALRCRYEDCVNPDVGKLAKCTNMRLSYVHNVECPAIRACPTCGLLLEHNGFDCKNLKCKRCKVEFCFLCLKLTSICDPNHGPYTVCSVAPRQTEIPVWKR